MAVAKKLDYPQLINACVYLYHLSCAKQFLPRHRKLLDDVTQMLALVFDSLGRVASVPARQLFDSSDPHPNSPGYVILKQNAHQVMVPFHLLPDFPKGPMLNELCELATILRKGQESTICISGSSCHASAVDHVNDIDYCEYAAIADSTVIQGFVDAPNIASKRLCCYQLLAWERPWPAEWGKSRKRRFSDIRRRFKKSEWRICKFTADLPTTGVLETTNLVLVVDAADSETGAGQASFAYQEGPLAASGWLPRELASPLQLGAYVSWLKEQIKKIVASGERDPSLMIKAAKRELSLARITMLSRVADKLIGTLHKKGGAKAAALAARCALYKKVTETKDSTLLEFLPNLEGAINDIRGRRAKNVKQYSCLNRAETQKVKQFTAAIVTILQELIAEVDDIQLSIHNGTK